MTDRTCKIILCCKGHLYNDPIKSIKKCIATECGVSEYSYSDRDVLDFVYDAIQDYVISAPREPAYMFATTFLVAGNPANLYLVTDNPTPLSLYIAILHQLRVRDHGQCVAGFAEDQLQRCDEYLDRIKEFNTAEATNDR